MSLELAHTKPGPIEASTRDSLIHLDEYTYTIPTFLENVKKVFVGETKRWILPQAGRGMREVPMFVIFKNDLIESVALGGHVIDFSDFLFLVEYVLTNTNLDKDDPRVPFVDFVKSIDRTRSYMETTSWERFVESVSILKVSDGYPSFTYGKRTNTGAKRLAYQFE